MAAFTIAFAPPVASGRVFAATASKTSGREEKGLVDWILGGLQKDQMLETDPILKKVEEKNGGPPDKSSVAPPKKKNGGGFGGLFAKK